MEQLRYIRSSGDILPAYRNTPVGLYLEYHDLNRPFVDYSSPQLLIGFCMDYRKNLRIPENFTYIMRTGGANLKGKEFNISYAIGVGNIRYIALVGHNRCGMSNIKAHREDFVRGMVNNAGWTQKKAASYFDEETPKYEIGDETDFIHNEAKRLRALYPAIVISPLHYFLDDNSISQIIEE